MLTSFAHFSFECNYINHTVVHKSNLALGPSTFITGLCPSTHHRNTCHRPPRCLSLFAPSRLQRSPTRRRCHAAPPHHGLSQLRRGLTSSATTTHCLLNFATHSCRQPSIFGCRCSATPSYHVQSSTSWLPSLALARPESGRWATSIFR